MTRVVIEADGGSRGNPGPAGYGAVVRDADSGAVLREVAAGIGVASNNVAEYRGLIAGLEAALDCGADEVLVRMDSLLVVNQMSSKWQVKHEAMKPLASAAAALVRRFREVRFEHVPRARNAHADALANAAMDAAARGEVWVADSAARPAHAAAPRVPVGRAAHYGWVMPTGTTTVGLLVRHGRTPLSIDRRFSGIGDPELDSTGHAQAQSLAARLADADVAAVLSSPRRRARQTATPIAAKLGLEVEVDDDLRETDFGEWEGLTLAEVAERWPEELAAWRASVDVAPPGGEPLSAAFERAGRVRARLVQDYPGRVVALVSHVTPIKALVVEALAAPAAALMRMQLDPGALSVVDWQTDGAVVRLVNDTSHLV